MSKNRIKELRVDAGLSQDKLAELVGTVKSKISTLENGKQQLTQSWMERISKALNCSPTDLLPKTNENKSSETPEEVINRFTVGFEEDESLMSARDAFLANLRRVNKEKDK